MMKKAANFERRKEEKKWRTNYRKIVKFDGAAIVPHLPEIVSNGCQLGISKKCLLPHRKWVVCVCCSCRNSPWIDEIGKSIRSLSANVDSMHEITESNTMKKNSKNEQPLTVHAFKYKHTWDETIWCMRCLVGQRERTKMTRELKALQLYTQNVWHEVVDFSALLISISCIPIIEHVSIRFLYGRSRIKHTKILFLCETTEHRSHSSYTPPTLFLSSLLSELWNWTFLAFRHEQTLCALFCCFSLRLFF